MEQVRRDIDIHYQKIIKQSKSYDKNSHFFTQENELKRQLKDGYYGN